MLKKILITGANGRIGRVLVDGLRQAGRYEVIATDIVPDAERLVGVADVTDFEALNFAMPSVDMVIHLAWFMKSGSFHEKIMPVNIGGTYNLYEAAHRNGVRRVIFGSSNHVTGFYPADQMTTPDMPMRPDSLYGLGKSWGEMVGQLYADRHGISVINVRIGNFSVEDKPGSLRATRIWISHRDMIQLVECCIEADESIKFLTLFGTSGNTRNWYPMDYLEDLIGYKPLDNGEDFVEAIRQAQPDAEDNAAFQGGSAVRQETR
jgi:uronate dehydrogenase